MIFGGIDPKTFLSTPEEWHSLVIGFCVGFCPWLYKLLPIDIHTPPIKGEEHYFVVGVIPGSVALVFFALGVVNFIQEVLL